MSGEPLTPHAALEREMGLRGAPPTPMSVEGLPSDDPDDTPPGRQGLVSYSHDGDSLFSPAEPSGPAGGAHEMSESDGMLNLLGDLLGGGGGGGGNDGTGALIAQLEAMADEFEQQSGEPEVEIRAKIATLRSVLDARDAAVSTGRSRMEAAFAALDADDGASAAAAGEAAALRTSLGVAANIEASLGQVDASLAADPDTAAFVGGIMSRAQQRQRQQQQEQVSAMYDY